jgi:hypothetical protein
MIPVRFRGLRAKVLTFSILMLSGCQFLQSGCEGTEAGLQLSLSIIPASSEDSAAYAQIYLIVSGDETLEFLITDGGIQERTFLETRTNDMPYLRIQDKTDTPIVLGSDTPSVGHLKREFEADLYNDVRVSSSRKTCEGISNVDSVLLKGRFPVYICHTSGAPACD